MNLTLTNDEANLVRYSLYEMAQARLDRAIEGRKVRAPWAKADEKESKKCLEIIKRIEQSDTKL